MGPCAMEGHAVGLTRSIELMGEGRLAVEPQRQLHHHFRSAAEASIRRDDVPSARAALIRNYFRLLAEERDK